MSAAELLNAEQMAEGLYLAREAVEHHCDTDLAVRAFDQLERIQDELNEARATAEICQRAVQTLRLELEAERAKVLRNAQAMELLQTLHRVRIQMVADMSSEAPLQEWVNAWADVKILLAKAGGA